MRAPSKYSIFWPSLCAFFIALGFVFFAPGDIRKDAYEYDSIARSIVTTGTFSLHGQPTMLREPGYPFFRAGLYALGANEFVILLAQALLAAVAVFLIGDVFRRLDGSGFVAAWTAAGAYGFSNYASSHYSEAVTGFFVALVGWLALRCMDGAGRKYYFFLVLASASLCLTRMNMAFIPPILFFAIAVRSYSASWRRSMGRFVSLVFCFLLLLTPWIVRNGRIFDQWAISGRSGVQFYARMVKAGEPFSRLGGTIVSNVFGTVVATALHLHPVTVYDPWHPTWDRYRFLMETEGKAMFDADQQMRKEALGRIFSEPRYFAGYVAWIPIEVLRLWALPSPGSPGFAVEGMFFSTWQAHRLTSLHVFTLILAHGLQMIFWTLLAISLWRGWKVYTWRWIPGWLFLAVTLAHIPFDAIIRYSAPVQPWMWGVIGWLGANVVEKHRAFFLRLARR